MKKTPVVVGLILVLLLSSCSQIPIPVITTPTAATGPTIDITGTSGALFNTAVAQTLTAQPSSTPTSVPGTDTATLPVVVTSPTQPPTLPPSDTPPATFTPVIDLTTANATATGNVPTATGGSANPAAIATSTPTLVPGQVTAIWTLAIRTYGTLPPLVPFVHMTLVNTTKAQAYISLHADMPDGHNTVIEYPVKGTIRIEAPVAFYHYVVWIGGNKMVGDFRVHQDDDISILLYTNKVVIK